MAANLTVQNAISQAELLRWCSLPKPPHVATHSTNIVYNSSTWYLEGAFVFIKRS
ncbi:hypothetical protein I79_004609 [Cricetulus griseus]|uniref:Uncharacterized protein n=1 Tax=Cricetulus griseus TaxID=10029 RepID=G3H304_CRIGR|nr:hypothetical protein I79_004609 [Cricetulus griseus]